MQRRAFIGGLTATAAALAATQHGAPPAKPEPPSDDLARRLRRMELLKGITSDGRPARAINTVEEIDAALEHEAKTGEPWPGTLVVPMGLLSEQLSHLTPRQQAVLDAFYAKRRVC